MKAKVVWSEKMKFQGEANNFSVKLDAKKPIGSDEGMTPKEAVLIGLCGCTAMDVVALLRKFKQTHRALEVSVVANPTAEGVHPVMFKDFHLEYTCTGEVESEKLIEAVKLSLTKYCSVSAMLSKVGPISYIVKLNDVKVSEGQAHFE